MKRNFIFSIGITVAIAVCAQTEADSIASTQLDEIEVSAVRKSVSPNARGLKVSMSGNPLGDIGSAIDAIKQMPMIDASAGSIEVTGRGKPVFYINGHLMRSMNELELLSSKDLDSVEIITNPSSKYGPEVTSVILIKTKKRAEGLHADIAATLTASEKMSESAKGGIGYRMENGLYLFGDFSIEESRFRQKRLYSETVGSDTGNVGHSDTYMTGNNRTRSLTADCGLIYNFGNHSIGAKYTFSRTPSMRFRSHSLTHTYLIPEEEIYSSDIIQSRSFRHYLNSFLHFALPQSINLRTDLDYIHGGSTSANIANEIQTETTIENIGDTRSDLFAAKIEIEKNLGGFSVSVGGDYTYTDHLQDFTSHATGEVAQILSPATDDVTQHLYSGFLSFDWKMSENG